MRFLLIIWLGTIGLERFDLLNFEGNFAFTAFFNFISIDSISCNFSAYLFYIIN